MRPPSSAVMGREAPQQWRSYDAPWPSHNLPRLCPIHSLIDLNAVALKPCHATVVGVFQPAKEFARSANGLVDKIGHAVKLNDALAVMEPDVVAYGVSEDDVAVFVATADVRREFACPVIQVKLNLTIGDGRMCVYTARGR